MRTDASDGEGLCLTVMRDRYIYGWPGHELGEATHSLPIGAALTRCYSTDAHLVQYTSSVPRRLTTEAIGQCDITMGVIVFDVDSSAAHDEGQPTPQEWRDDLRERIWTLDRNHSGAYYYETKGGARIVYRLAEPSVIDSEQAAIAWRREYLVAVAYLERTEGIIADPLCGDWTRLFRLPRATRERGGQPENWYTAGDPYAIGTLEIEPCAADIARAQELTVRRSA